MIRAATRVRVIGDSAFLGMVGVVLSSASGSDRGDFLSALVQLATKEWPFAGKPVWFSAGELATEGPLP